MSTTTNRRRFERVPLALDWGSAQPIIGAEWHWSNHEVAQVFDMSYQGLAVAQGALLVLKTDQTVLGELVMGDFGRLKLSARVAWTKGALVGLELNAVSVSDRQMIEKFLKDKLIGLHMRRVDPKFFSPAADFSIWYHGPADTNVYLWQSRSNRFHRAEIEFSEEVLMYDQGSISPKGNVELLRRVLAVLSQIREPHELLKELVTHLVKGLK